MPMNTTQLLTDTSFIIPELIVAAVALIVLVWDFVFPRGNKNKLAYFSLLGLAIAMIYSFSLLGESKVIFSQLMVVDYFAVVFKLIFLTIAALVVLISVSYLKVEQINRGEYYALVLFAILGAMLMAAATDFLSIYLGLELTAISSYILCGFMTEDIRSNEAALKYFVLGLFASAILIYGVSLIYGVCGSTNLYRIEKMLTGISPDQINVALWAGMVLVMVSFSFKIAAVPFHMWVPDVYEGAPTSVTAFMSVGPKIAGFAALLRVFGVAIFALKVEWGFLFAILAVITVIAGNILALRQDSIKRMLAYSGIAHVGYALIGVVAATVSRQIGLTSVVFYFIMYFVAQIGAFGVIIFLCQKHRMGDTYEDFKGLGQASPGAAMVMTIFMLSLLGIPPTGGFMGKIWIFAAAVKADYLWLALVGVLSAVISAYYYLRVVVVMYMHQPEQVPTRVISPSLIIALGLMALITVYMGVNPAPFLKWAQHSTAAIL